MTNELQKCLMALIHPNKFNNPLFAEFRPQIETIRNVSQKYSQACYYKFLSEPSFCFLFLKVFKDQEVDLA